MTVWFTSDLHFNHIHIIDYSHRPFKDLDEMNRAMINNYNEVVNHDDMVVFVGDVCMGSRVSTLPLMHHLHGYKVLVPGNHDYCHPMFSDKPQKYEAHFEMYSQYFDDIISDSFYFYDPFQICHFPYDVNSTDHADRDFGKWEPIDNGVPLICGHVHEEWKIHVSKKGTFMYNVGVDVNDFTPVCYDDIFAAYKEHSLGEN